MGYIGIQRNTMASKKSECLALSFGCRIWKYTMLMNLERELCLILLLLKETIRLPSTLIVMFFTFLLLILLSCVMILMILISGNGKKLSAGLRWVAGPTALNRLTFTPITNTSSWKDMQHLQ